MLLVCRPIPAAQPTSEPISGEHVLRYLNETIDWYRQVQTLDASPAIGSHELLIRANVRHNAQETTRLAIQFARAEAALLEANAASTQPAAPAGNASARGRNLAALAASADQQARRLQDQIAQLEVDRSKAPAASQPAFAARRENLIAQLNLATARRDVLSEYSGFVSAAQGGDAVGLSAKVEELARTVPEVSASPGGGGPTTMPSADGSSNAPADNNGGLLDNIRDMFTLTGDLTELHDLTGQAEKLAEENDKLRAPIQAKILDAVHRAQAMSAVDYEHRFASRPQNYGGY